MLEADAAQPDASDKPFVAGLDHSGQLAFEQPAVLHHGRGIGALPGEDAEIDCGQSVGAQRAQVLLDLLTELMPRKQILLKRPDVAKVLNLNVDPRSYWLYTNTPVDNERVTTIFREYGFAAGLDRLAASA